jgi:AAA+ ATPase superfamily predicted ATPase
MAGGFFVYMEYALYHVYIIMHKPFADYPPFINRVKEREYFLDYFGASPTKILFVYGPKSTGKTTLINRVMEEFPPTEYAISYIDMRRILIRNFVDFKNVFFPTSLKGKIAKIVSGITMSV